MVRLLLLLLGVSAILAGGVYLAASWWAAPHRRLLRQFRRMRGMILEGVDADHRPRAERLLEDCEQRLQGLVRARQRLDVLDEMADAAVEFADIEDPIDRERLESKIHEDVEYFITEMGRICAEVDHDWNESMARLERFTDELADQREAFAELEDLSGR